MVKVNENKADEMIHGPMSSLSSDGSFVVLGHSPPRESNMQLPVSSHSGHQPPSFPPIPGHNSFTSTTGRLESQVSHNFSLFPSSLSTDLSPEEIQRKLQELLQENLELKETLDQNNLAMKQQFATLVKWRDDVCKVHQDHKTKFSETKELVLKLRAENTELKRVLEEYKNAGSAIPSASETELKMENVKLKGQIAELQQKLAAPVARKDMVGAPSKKEIELSALVEQLNRQLETAERSRRQLTLDVERVTAQRTRLERDLEQHKEQFQELKKEMSALSKQYGVDVHNLTEVQGQMSQPNSALLRELEGQKETINNLIQQLNEERAKVAAASVPKMSVPSVQDKTVMANNMRECEKTLEHLSGCMDQEAVRLNNLDSWLEVACESVNQWKGKPSVDTHTVATLRAEIEELRKLLSQEQIQSQEKKKSLDEAQQKFHALYMDYQNVISQLKTITDEQKDSSAYQEIQTRGFTEKIDSMTALLINKEETLTHKTKEVDQLREKIKKLELENEAITILKAQVEVYQSDFNAEREARENLAGEKERLAEDLRHLQRRNQQLLDELEAYQQNQFEQIQRQTPPTGSSQNASGWNTIAAPGRGSDRSSQPRSSPGRPSPGRTVSGPQGEPTAPQTSLEQNEPPYRGEDPLPTQYSCPKCMIMYTEYPKLVEHVEECLDL